MSREGLRWWQYVGPWPFRPWVVFWGVGAVNLISATSQARSSIVERPIAGFAQVFLPALLGTVVLSLLVHLGACAFPERRPRRLPAYVLFLIGAAGVGAVASFAVAIAIRVGNLDDAIYLPFQAMRAALWSIVLLAIAGLTVQRLGRQTERAEEALVLAREQQELMLINDEQSRRQVAALLHDKVQAGLMAACLELRLAAQATGSVASEEVERFVARIDDIRGLDVRQAARSLSPDLTNVDMRTALTELARIHEPGMLTQVEIRPHALTEPPEPSPDTLLACYRIVEQGLLNAVVHGHASAASLTISRRGEVLVLRLEDNGTKGLAATAQPGFGSAVIDSWCRVLDGSWSLGSRELGGAVLEVSLPLSQL